MVDADVLARLERGEVAVEQDRVTRLGLPPDLAVVDPDVIDVVAAIDERRLGGACGAQRSRPEQASSDPAMVLDPRKPTTFPDPSSYGKVNPLRVTYAELVTTIVDPAAKIAPPVLLASMEIPAAALPTFAETVNAPE